mgnify:CR=1 FL=1
MFVRISTWIMRRTRDISGYSKFHMNYGSYKRYLSIFQVPHELWGVQAISQHIPSSTWIMGCTSDISSYSKFHMNYGSYKRYLSIFQVPHELWVVQAISQPIPSSTWIMGRTSDISAYSLLMCRAEQMQTDCL